MAFSTALTASHHLSQQMEFVRLSWRWLICNQVNEEELQSIHRSRDDSWANILRLIFIFKLRLVHTVHRHQSLPALHLCFSQFENQKLKPVAAWRVVCSSTERPVSHLLYSFLEMTSVWGRLGFTTQWEMWKLGAGVVKLTWSCGGGKMRKYNKIKPGLSPHVYAADTDLLWSLLANSFCILKRHVFMLVLITKRSWHPLSVWIHNRSQCMLPHIMYARKLLIVSVLLSASHIIWAENEICRKSAFPGGRIWEGFFIESGGWSGKWWELRQSLSSVWQGKQESSNLAMATTSWLQVCGGKGTYWCLSVTWQTASFLLM